MGCAASADNHEPSRTKDREPTKVAPSKFAPQNGLRQPYAKDMAADGTDRNHQSSPPGGGASSSRQDVHNNSSTNLLTQSLLSDLRLRSTKDGPGIPRWVEGIVLPSVEDNVDLYDPLRRHKLAMESIATRQKKPTNGLSSSSNPHHAAGSLSSQPKKPSSDASNSSQHNGAGGGGTADDPKEGSGAPTVAAAAELQQQQGGAADAATRSPRPGKSQSNHNGPTNAEHPATPD